MTEIENQIIEIWRIHNRILLTMKQSGFKLPDALKWHIWEWNKR